MKLWRIYGYRNIFTNEWYVGQTLHLMKIRVGKNGESYKDSPKFWEAIQKYGWGSFEENILRLCTSQEEADYWERFFMRKYDTIDNGYNISTTGRKGKKVFQYSMSGDLIAVFPSMIEAIRQNYHLGSLSAFLSGKLKGEYLDGCRWERE